MSLDAPFARLCAQLISAFRDWGGSGAPGSWSEDRFNALALRAFELQLEGIPAFRRYSEARGAGPGNVESWREIPPVPTAAFRAVDFIIGGPEEAAVTFLTSGTSGGAAARGRHPVRDLDLYRASLEAGFRRFVLAPLPAGGGADQTPGGGDLPEIRMLSLIPPFSTTRDSSLAWMADAVIARFGAPGSGHVRPGGRPGDVNGTVATAVWSAALEAAEAAGEDDVPVCVLATTLGLDAWMRDLAGREVRLRLPAGSRAMDTGGAKGRQDLDRERVLDAMEDRLALPREAVVNEFGMTELLSQRYARGGGLLRGPPWLRTRALDPVTLDELPSGEAGVLCHFDVANAGSVCAVLTEDIGRVHEEGVEWVGRAPGAPPRGCSLATAELLEAQTRATAGRPPPPA